MNVSDKIQKANNGLLGLTSHVKYEYNIILNSWILI